jgi:hypothetical protein
MPINKKLLVIAGLAGIVTLSIAASAPQEKEKPRNLKVLPKKISDKQLHMLMRGWAISLGVRCNFCHEQDFASDAKPEKIAARHMFQMVSKINKKFFQGQKDSLGMVMESSVNCYTCHRGSAHPEVKLPEPQRPGGPSAGGTPPPPGSTPPGQ